MSTDGGQSNRLGVKDKGSEVASLLSHETRIAKSLVIHEVRAQLWGKGRKQ